MLIIFNYTLTTYIDIVYIALGGCGQDQVIVVETHIDDSLSNFELFIHFVQKIDNFNDIVFNKLDLPVAP